MIFDKIDDSKNQKSKNQKLKIKNQKINFQNWSKIQNHDIIDFWWHPPEIWRFQWTPKKDPIRILYIRPCFGAVFGPLFDRYMGIFAAPREGSVKMPLQKWTPKITPKMIKKGVFFAPKWVILTLKSEMCTKWPNIWILDPLGPPKSTPKMDDFGAVFGPLFGGLFKKSPKGLCICRCFCRS